MNIKLTYPQDPSGPELYMVAIIYFARNFPKYIIKHIISVYLYRMAATTL